MELRKAYSIVAFIVLPFLIPPLHFHPTSLSESLKGLSYAFPIVIIRHFTCKLSVVVELIAAYTGMITCWNMYFATDKPMRR